MARGAESAWVQSLISVIDGLVGPLSTDDSSVHACWGHKVAYAHEIMRYDSDDRPSARVVKYETDLLVYDEARDGSWVPRVVIECKLGGVTTHDALTYSSKASTHKQVHPYLRYGILIGDWKGYPLPGRLIRHGAYFDFMTVFDGFELTAEEIKDLGEVLNAEVGASRLLQKLLSDRTKGRQKYRSLHRPLRLI